MEYTNNLKNETSPYLLQHASNPVNWYPWGSEAFDRAKKEDKPIFLSIGYSTCHWCHVMAHESFEDTEIARILNDNFISIKVDKEERPDIDSIYMSVCQTFTGSGGWPTSIFMTPEQRPFYAGTYFPKRSQYGMVGFGDLLKAISLKWKSDRQSLVKSGDEVTKLLGIKLHSRAEVSEDLLTNAVSSFKGSFDKNNGGFGSAPKFPTPHNLLFLMDYYESAKDRQALQMAEKTLVQMYRGGIFDHIGGGFSRYSTDNYYLVPHFEKMLYDNALLMLCYTRAFNITKNELYKKVAEKTSDYVLRELTDAQGGFYCAQDADSEGVEGKYYVFDYDEIIELLGKEAGAKFCRQYDITRQGNFEGSNIPNLLKNTEYTDSLEVYLPKLYDYRKSRTRLHLDDKILTSWTSLMIAAFSYMYRTFDNIVYIEAARKACDFIDEKLAEDDTLFVSFRDGKRSGKGFLDDYSFYVYALINMYEATLEQGFLDRALKLNGKTMEEFYDEENGGFYLYGRNNEQLIIKPKDTYDGAIPSGNSVMAYNLIKLSRITQDFRLEKKALEQLEFMASYARKYPAGYTFCLSALAMYLQPSKDIVCVLKSVQDKQRLKSLSNRNANIRVFETPTDDYRLVNDKTTFYVCQNHRCLPPTNNFEEVLK